VAFTRSLSQQLIRQGIRVNAVAPGPIWTPLIPATMPRIAWPPSARTSPWAGQPEELAPCYLFLASEDGSYMAGQVLHPNGGNVVNG
jgi:NAD(P)-dependent dehydrogenase (short-subunit alcohol dehydrogenase family)